jgi:hypothetical protein
MYVLHTYVQCMYYVHMYVQCLYYVDMYNVYRTLFNANMKNKSKLEMLACR